MVCPSFGLMFLTKKVFGGAWQGQSHAENDEDAKAIVCLEKAVEKDAYNLEVPGVPGWLQLGLCVRPVCAARALAGRLLIDCRTVLFAFLLRPQALALLGVSYVNEKNQPKALATLQVSDLVEFVFVVGVIVLCFAVDVVIRGGGAGESDPSSCLKAYHATVDFTCTFLTLSHDVPWCVWELD